MDGFSGIRTLTLIWQKILEEADRADKSTIWQINLVNSIVLYLVVLFAFTQVQYQDC
jgi:hypothetical protein